MIIIDAISAYAVLGLIGIAFTEYRKRKIEKNQES